MPDPTVLIKILAQNKVAKKVLDETAGSAAKIESAFGSMAVPAGAALAGIALGASKAADAASKVEQSSGAVESVFKGNSDAVKKFASDSAKSTGLATSDYQQMAAVLGAQLKGMGVPQGELAKKTDELIHKGSDLAATFGGETSDAVSAISALLRGERDPIERYGVSIKEADVAARLAADGFTSASKATAGYAKATAGVESAQKGVDKSHAAVIKAQEKLAAAQKSGTPAQVAAAKSALAIAKGNDAAAVAHLAEAEAAKTAAGAVPKLTTDQEKAAASAATLALLTGKTADAQGAFARETDTAAHAQQVSNAQMENAMAALGTALLPIIVLVTGKLGEMAAFVTANASAFQILIGVVAGIAAAILAVNVAFKVYQAGMLLVRGATAAYTAVQWLLNAALNANPIGIIIIAILALVAGFVLLWQNSETFRTIVTGVFNTVLGVVQSVIGTITGIFGTLFAILQKPFDKWLAAVRAVIGTIKDIVKGVADFISGIFKGITDAAGKIGSAIDAVNPFGAVPPATAARAVTGPWTRAAARSGGGGSSGGITINVTTTGDSIEAEEAVVRALRRAQRLNAGRVFGSFGSQSSARRGLALGPGIGPGPSGPELNPV